MTCEPLAYTGSGAPVDLVLTVGIACLTGGAMLLLMTTRRGRAVTVALLLLLGAATFSTIAGTPAHASADECAPVHARPAKNFLTISQTSVMVGLAPGLTPMPITGIVSNNGTDSTDIVAIDARITGVITDPRAMPGVCDATDYVLRNPLMPVGRTLASGGSTAFDGASIGFSNKSTNQDACKGATVELLYTANPNTANPNTAIPNTAIPMIANPN